jgi:hypothetical protein
MSGPAEHQSKSQEGQLKDAALALVRERAWAVFPCGVKSKLPLIAAKDGGQGYKDATRDVDKITAWWSAHPQANIGVATGEMSDIVVIDTDGPDGEASWAKLCEDHEEPETLTSRTGRADGGRHLIFRRPAGVTIKNSASKLGPHLDVRGDGGYIVAPPSIHPTGNAYAFVDPTMPVAPLPNWLLDKLTAKPAPAVSTPPTRPLPSGETGTTLDQVKRALGELAPHHVADRETWIEVGLCIHSVDQSDRGFEVWKDWSRTWEKFNEDEWRVGDERDDGEHHRNWKRFKSNGGKTVGTLFQMADDDAEAAGLIMGDTVRIETVDWLWYGRIAFKKLQGIVGLADKGKDTILFDIGARLSRGAPFSDGRPSTRGEPRPTYYLSAEDALADTVMPRFIAAGGDRQYFGSRLLYRRRGRDEPLTIEGDHLRVISNDLARIQRLRQCGPGLIVLSPFEAFMSKHVDSWKSGDIRGVLYPLKLLVERTGWALVVIAHFTKGGNDGPLIHRIAGSQAFAAALRIIYAVGADPTVVPNGPDADRRVFVPLKRNLVPPGVTGLAYTLVSAPTPDIPNPSPEQTVPVVKWLGETTVTAEDMGRGPTKGDDSAARYEAWLLKQFEQHGVAQPDGARVLTTARLEELCASAGLPWNSVRARLRPLGATPAREKDATTGKHAGTTWRLDEGDLF